MFVPIFYPATAHVRKKRMEFLHASGKGPRQRLSTLHSATAAAVLIAVCFVFPVVCSAQVKRVRRLLILYESSPSSPLPNLVDHGIETALDNSPYLIEFYREYMETASFPDPADQQMFRDYYIRKYQNRRPNVVIAVGPSPLQFMLEMHKTSFAGVPVIFCLPNRISGSSMTDSDFTGVEGDIAPARTLAAALRLQPGTMHVVVVSGTSPFDRQQNAAVKDQLKTYEGRLDISYLTDLAMPDLLERLKHLPSHTIVILGALGRDAAGARFTLAESGPMVVAAANAPVFTLNDRALNHGEVGGDVSNSFEQGRVVGGMALRLLNGEKPRDVPAVKNETTYMFDWRALKRWGLNEKDLPPGSVILNRQSSPWELYKSYILGGICLILLESVLISGLLLQRLRRRRAENELAMSNDRLRMAVEAGKAVGWDWDVKGGTDRWFGDLQTVFGIPADTYSGTVADFRRRVHPDDRELVSKAISDARLSRQPYRTEFRVIRDDQTVRWITASGKFYHATNGDPVRMLGMAVDITERKRAEHSLRESEERFRLVANLAPVMIWMSSSDKLCTYFNQPWLEFTGRPLEAELGNGWADRVHPEDLETCLNTYTQSFDRRQSFQMQYRLLRRDGEYRWVLDMGVPRFTPDGFFEGYIGSCIDVTDRKLAEEALANIGRRLIAAHEEERTRIARELHDDINQRIALLSIELEGWNQQLPEVPAEFHDHIQHARQRLFDITKDVQALSHRLHSSKLEYLGLAAAANTFCKELSEQQKVEIEFSHSDLPHTIPTEISLCLFRVLQEGLQNAVKHSGARRFKVELRGMPEEIHLTVNDLGIGFDWREAMSGRGLGLISMRERLQLVKGELSIKSEPGRGSTISARVPLAA